LVTGGLTSSLSGTRCGFMCGQAEIRFTRSLSCHWARSYFFIVWDAAVGKTYRRSAFFYLYDVGPAKG
ncbi:hypothetical protein, partial [Enterobacter hormaechei]|uniref:hypothetical protein n=1 Tax=Enterobacter hormaechei TaxID=158836 RepID=UPI001F3E4346